jgi:hypothetical protein
MAMTNLLLLPHRRYIYRTPALKEVNAQALILWDDCRSPATAPQLAASRPADNLVGHDMLS